MTVVLAVLIILGIALGVGLGVGLQSNKGLRVFDQTFFKNNNLLKEILLEIK